MLKWKYRTNLLWISALILAAGCAVREPAQDSTDPRASSGQAAVAVFEGTDAAVPKSSFNRMVGGTLYYLDSKWDNETRKLINCSGWKCERGEGEPERIADFGDAEVLLFFVDEAEFVYCLYAETDENGPEAYFFTKLDSEGMSVYDVPVSYQGTPAGQGVLSRFGTVAAGEADGEGRACLADTQGNLYLFDADGVLARIGKAPLDCGFL